MPEINLPIFENLPGSIINDLDDDGAFIKSKIESLVSSNSFFLTDVTSPEYSHISVYIGMLSMALTMKPYINLFLLVFYLLQSL
jgi:hypothetical protein